MKFSGRVPAAQTGDVSVTPCPKDPSALLVRISGESAMEIYTFFSKTKHIPLSELGGTMMNDMNCSPLATIMPTDGPKDPSGAECSFVMKNGKNIPYPQIDPGMTGEPRIECR